MYRVSIAKQVSGLIGLGSMPKSTFGFGFRPFRFSGLRVSRKEKNQISDWKMASFPETCEILVRIYLDFKIKSSLIEVKVDACKM